MSLKHSYISYATYRKESPAVIFEIVRRVWRYQRDNQNRRNTDNAMDKRKRTRGQTSIYKTYTCN